MFPARDAAVPPEPEPDAPEMAAAPNAIAPSARTPAAAFTIFCDMEALPLVDSQRLPPPAGACLRLA
jgi:hypothetical protein